MLPLLLLFLSFPLLVITAAASTKVWDGSASGLWNVAANWTNNAAPVNGDALIFPNGTARLLTTNSAGAAVNFNSLHFTGPGYELHGPALSITNGLTNSTFFGGGNTLHAAVNVRGSQTWSVAGRTTLTLAGNANFSGLSVTGLISGTLQLNGTLTGTFASRFHKHGGGRMVINGSGVVGHIVVNDGTLQADGAMGSGGQITVESGALLTGAGVVSPFTSRGTVSPGGALPGRLSVTDAGNDVILSTTNSLYAVQIQGTTPGADYDQLSVPGPLQILGSRLEVTVGAGFAPSPGHAFVIVTNTGALPVTGSFAGLPEGSHFSVSNSTFRISYVGGNGNDVELRAIGASGDTRVWDGGSASALWTDGANWVGNLPAAAGDVLVFPGSVAARERTNQNNLPAGTPFQRLALGGSNWVLHGNSIRLLGGLEVTNRTAGPVPIVNLPIVLDTNQTWRLRSNSLTMRGALDLGTNTLTVQVTNGVLRLAGPVSGAGRVFKRGSGDLDLGGTNTFTGGVQIAEGLANASGLHLSGSPWTLTGPSGRLLISRVVPGLNASAGVVVIPSSSSGSRVAGNFNLGPTVTLDYSEALNTLSVTGTVNLAGASLSGMPAAVGAFQFGATESVLIQNDGIDPVLGTFSGLPEGALLPAIVGSLSNRLTYVGGDGNDVALRTEPPLATRVTRIWDGGGTNHTWSTAGNWVANIRPDPGDDLLFPDNAAQKRNQVNGATAAAVFFANSLRFDGAGYAITNFVSSTPFAFNFGVVELTAGITAAQPSGTNLLSTIIGIMADQDWNVASSDAALRLGGAVTGIGDVRKTGPGLLEGEDALFTNGVRFVNVSGPSRFRDCAFESAVVSGGSFDLRGGGALSLTATGGVAHLSGSVITRLSVADAELRITAGTLGGGGQFPGATTNFSLGAQARCVVDFPVSNSIAVLLLGSLNIAPGAQLDVQVTYPARPGDILAVAAPFAGGAFVPFPPIFPLPTNQPPPAVISGTFSGLPDGAVTNFSGRPFRINYSLTNGPVVVPGVYLTALTIPPRLTLIARRDDGSVLVQGVGEPFAPVLLEGSQDFTQWTVLDNATINATGRFTSGDAFAASLPFRFYRARLP